MDEFVPVELAALYQCSVGSATWFVRDVVNLHARHPAVWQALQQGRLPLWRARQIAQYTAAFELSADEAIAVDERLRVAIGRVQWKRLWWVLRAAVLQVAPERVRAVAERSRTARFVRMAAVTDDPTVSYLSGRVDTADALGIDSLLSDIAAALRASGEDGSTDELRARALGLLADPQQVLELLETSGAGTPPGSGDQPGQPDGEDGRVALNAEEGGAPTPRRSRRRVATQLYVHVAATRLGGDDVARVEGLGPVLVDQLRQLAGGGPIRVTPVVHAGGGVERAVDGYEIPAPIRAEVVVRDRFEIFPFSARDARTTDLDHTVPYRSGAAAQTRASNLGPLSRRSHRAKTHGGWQLFQPRPGVFWWRSPRDQVYRVGPDGSRNVTLGDPASNLSGTEQLLLWEIDRRLGGEGDTGRPAS